MMNGMLTESRVYAMNGKSIEIDNTDAEGRLVLSGQFSHPEQVGMCR